MFSWVKRWRLLSLSAGQFEYLWLIVLATAVGITAALGNLGFQALIRLCGAIFLRREAHALGVQHGLPWSLLLPLVLVSGGVVLVILEWLFPGDVLGYGFSNFLRMVHFGGARIKRRWIFLKAAGSALSLGAGASVGREGPIAQIGGAIGSAIAQSTHLSTEHAKVLVACGAGAGIATTFNAPLGGLLFAQEIVLLGETELTNLSLLVVSTAAGVVTSRALLGDLSVLPVQQFVMHSYWEIISYAALGVFLGVLSVIYIRSFYRTADFFTSLPIPVWARLLCGLAVVGLIAVPLRANLSDGYPVIDQALNGNVPLQMMAILFVAKFLASIISLACGAPGGVFGPVFFVGTMAGGTFHGLLHALFPRLVAGGLRGSYALLGLGAFLAGTTHAPLTSIFLLTEMTGNYGVTLAALVSSVIAMVVARSIEPNSIDTYALARQGISLEIEKDRLALTGVSVASIVKGEPTTLDAAAKLDVIFSVAASSTQDVLPVLDGQNNYLGAINTRDLVGLIASVGDLRELINAYDLSRSSFPSVGPQANLEDALHVMEDELTAALPVVDPDRPNQLLGLITRAEIGRVFSHATGGVSPFPSRDTYIFWSRGYRVARIRVPAAAESKTLRELGSRVRFGVNVLAVQNRDNPGAGFVLIEADEPLHGGDTLIVAGRSASIRAFERELHAT
jgi:CIC family chloride channel protein